MLALASVLVMASCNDRDNAGQIDDRLQPKPTEVCISGTIKGQLQMDYDGQVDGVDCYGMLIPSFTPKDMMNAGFEYTDLLDVQIGKVHLDSVPFVTGFNEVGVLETCFCDYNATNTMYGFGLLHGNFKERIGGNVGEPITITLCKRHGYADTYEIMHSVYDTIYAKYGNDTVFANFREVRTTGMKPGTLYRSSNPLNNSSNAVRYAYADRLARDRGIRTEIDLADTDAAIEGYMASPGFASTYCPELYRTGHVIALGLTADTYSETFKHKLAAGLRFMVDGEAPYLVHCNEGKDRCGFVTMLLEAFAGATYQELAADYMQTLTNFYFVQPGSNSYNVRQRLSVDRLVWLLQNEQAVDDFTHIDWAHADPTDVNPQEAAHQYILQCGLSEEECQQLYDKLTK